MTAWHAINKTKQNLASDLLKSTLNRPISQMVGDSWCLSVESGHVGESQWREGPGNMKAAAASCAGKTRFKTQGWRGSDPVAGCGGG